MKLPTLLHVTTLWLLLASSASSQSYESTQTPGPTVETGRHEIIERFPVRFTQHVETVETTPGEQSAETMPLARPSEAKGTAFSATPRGANGNVMTTVMASLSLVLASFFVVVWATKRHAPRGLALLPNEVVESLGRSPLAGRQQMQLIRLGRKLVLLSVTPSGAESLAEVTDPMEVDRLSGLCQQGRPGSISESFRHVLAQHGEAPTSNSFTGGPVTDSHSAGNRRFRRAV